MNDITICISHNGIDEPVSMPANCELGEIRSLSNTLENIGAPESYRLAVNGVQQPDSFNLSQGDRITFRPLTGDKG